MNKRVFTLLLWMTWVLLWVTRRGKKLRKSEKQFRNLRLDDRKRERKDSSENRVTHTTTNYPDRRVKIDRSLPSIYINYLSSWAQVRRSKKNQIVKFISSDLIIPLIHKISTKLERKEKWPVLENCKILGKTPTIHVPTFPTDTTTAPQCFIPAIYNYQLTPLLPLLAPPVQSSRGTGVSSVGVNT